MRMPCESLQLKFSNTIIFFEIITNLGRARISKVISVDVTFSCRDTYFRVRLQTNFTSQRGFDFTLVATSSAPT